MLSALALVAYETDNRDKSILIQIDRAGGCDIAITAVTMFDKLAEVANAAIISNDPEGARLP